MSYITDSDKKNLETIGNLRLGRFGEDHIIQDSYGNRYIKEESVYMIFDILDTIFNDIGRGSTIISGDIYFLNRGRY